MSRSNRAILAVVGILIYAVIVAYIIGELNAATKEITDGLPASHSSFYEEAYQQTLLGFRSVSYRVAESSRFLAWPIHQDDYLAKSSPIGPRDPATVGGHGDDFHDGFDMFGVWKARILSGARAFVVCVFPPANGYYRGHEVFGGLVILRVEYKSDVYYLVHGHLSETDVKENTWIDAGTQIGRQGNEGRSDGEHLHFGMNKNGTLDVETGEITGGKWVNPLLHLIPIGEAKT